MTDFSSFSVAKPQFLVLITAVLPAVLCVWSRARKIFKIAPTSPNGNFPRMLKVSLFLRTILRSFSWICMILALSGISFGSKKIPVVKSGSNISLVFDISYSMLAKDAEKNLSRLDAAKIYATNLVENLTESSFSVVLAKGSGFVALSETEDRAAILNLIENLSPHLMTSAGTSLSRGIDAAIEGIPEKSSKSQFIALFTDCDETDNQLEKSLERAARVGIPVSIFGFGREKETEITAGDGKTKVKTALRSKKTKEIVEKVNKSPSSLLSSNNRVTYIDAKSKGSASQILNFVKKSKSDENSVIYQSKNVSRHGFFIFWSLIFLVLSFCEINPSLFSVSKN